MNPVFFIVVLANTNTKKTKKIEHHFYESGVFDGGARKYRNRNTKKTKKIKHHLYESGVF